MIGIAAKTPPAPQRRAAAVLTWLTGLHLGAVVGLWGLVRFGADRWWLATVVMFGPLWLAVLPLVGLMPAAVLLRPRLLVVLAVDLALVVGPLAGFNVPWLPPDPPAGGARVRVLTCNVHWSKLRLNSDGGAVLGDLIREAEPDVVALEGYSSRYQSALFEPGRWHLARHDEILLASPHPVAEVEAPGREWFPKGGEFACFRVEAPGVTFHVCALHLASPRDGLDAVLRGGWRGAGAVAANTETRRRQTAVVSDLAGELGGPFLFAGDFNTPPESTLYREFWSPYANAFSRAGWGPGKTFFTRYDSVRIDHVLAGPGWRYRACRVGPDVGSPHRPVIADLEADGG